MNLRQLQDDGLEILAISGHFDDDWCEPEFTCKGRPKANLSVCQLDVWLKPELNRSAANFRVTLGGSVFQCAVPYDVRAVVQTACAIAAGETFSLEVECENRVLNRGGDLRHLSFQLVAIRFS